MQVGELHRGNTQVAALGPLAACTLLKELYRGNCMVLVLVARLLALGFSYSPSTLTLTPMV